MHVHVCLKNVFALQLHIEGVQVCSDVCEQSQVNESSWVREVTSVRKVLLTEEGGKFLLKVAHTRQHGSMTQSADLTELEQVIIVHIHLVHQ